MLLYVCLSIVINCYKKLCVFVCVCCEIIDRLKLKLFKKKKLFVYLIGPSKVMTNVVQYSEFYLAGIYSRHDEHMLVFAN